MTLEARRFAFLLRQKPICTQPVLRSALGSDLHRELRAKYKLELGVDLMGDKCASSFNCIAQDSGCIGRPFPIDEQIEEALKSMNVEVERGIFKGREVLLAKATVDCSSCPFRDGCESPCATQESYLKRSVSPDFSPKTNMTVNFESFEQGLHGNLKRLIDEIDEEDTDSTWRSESLPLDCLTPNQRLVVEGVIYEGKTQIQLSHELGISQQAVSNHYDAAISRLSEFAKARQIIKEHGCTLRIARYYLHNLTQDEIAQIEGVSQQAITQTITKWRSKWNI